MMMRRQILKVIRDEFNGSVERQGDIAIAICGNATSSMVSKNLKWLVEHGYLTVTRPGGFTKTYTLTEKAT